MKFKELKGSFCIFFILVIASGYASSAVMKDVEAPQNIKNQSVVIPQAGITITAPLRLIGKVNIVGRGPIRLKGKGRIIVEQNSKVAIENVSIAASEIKVSEDESVVYLISINTGARTSFSLHNSSIVLDIPYEKTNASAPWDEPPKYWAIGIPDVLSEFGSSTKVMLSGNKFRNIQPYGAGALSLRQTFVSQTPLTLRGEIIGNEFHGFHGAITANVLDGFKISRNRLVRNSFSNIFIGGQDVDVSDNDIYYPGDGNTGDGITVLNKLVNGRIEGNTIFVGSCYGILLRGDEIKGVLISDNNIINGITTAIQVEALSKKIESVTVSNNMISGNYGFAVTFLGVENSIIENNHFSGNARGFPSQIYVERSPGLAVRGNLNAQPLSPEWAKEHELYRTHVNIDDSTYTLPGVKAD